MSGASSALGPIGTVVGAVVGYALSPYTFGASAAAAAGLGATAGGAVGAAAGALTAKGPKLPALPTVLPMPDQSQIAQAQQQSVADQLARRGRASTILTPTNQNKLGG